MQNTWLSCAYIDAYPQFLLIAMGLIVENNHAFGERDENRPTPKM